MRTQCCSQCVKPLPYGPPLIFLQQDYEITYAAVYCSRKCQVRNAEENGAIEAKMILEEAYGEFLMRTGRISQMGQWGFARVLRAEEVLKHAADYVEELIPRYLQGIY